MNAAPRQRHVHVLHSRSTLHARSDIRGRRWSSAFPLAALMHPDRQALSMNMDGVQVRRRHHRYSLTERSAHRACLLQCILYLPWMPH
jgi:hypothetical protein